jgi:hypothetical protein
MLTTKLEKDLAMNLSKLAVVFLLFFILSSCTPALATPGKQPGVTETVIQAFSAPTLTPTIASQVTARKDFFNNFIDLIPVAFESVRVDGFLVLQSSRNFNELVFHFYDMKNKFVETGKNYEEINLYAVSPNRKFMLAGACPTEKCDYFLRTVDQIIITNLATEDDWVLTRWLDNEHVVFLPRIKPGQPVQPQNKVIYNVFTGEKMYIQLYLPNPKTIGSSGGPDNLFFATLDPSLKRVVFNDQSDRLVLWNLETQKEMASLPFADYVSSFDSSGWSPDRKNFATISPAELQEDASGNTIWAANELFVFDMDGNLMQLTHYNEKVPYASIFKPRWSSDNRHIAFWLTTGDDTSKPKNLQLWLAVFDTVILETRLYSSVSSTISSSIVWSPGGQQLIVSNQDSNLTLVDLARETKSPIPDTQDMRIWDWMAP